MSSVFLTDFRTAIAGVVRDLLGWEWNYVLTHKEIIMHTHCWWCPSLVKGGLACSVSFSVLAEVGSSNSCIECFKRRNGSSLILFAHLVASFKSQFCDERGGFKFKVCLHACWLKPFLHEGLMWVQWQFDADTVDVAVVVLLLIDVAFVSNVRWL
jgi:hypothetical protein